MIQFTKYRPWQTNLNTTAAGRLEWSSVRIGLSWYVLINVENYVIDYHIGKSELQIFEIKLYCKTSGLSNQLFKSLCL